jgi:hypothetical protein
LSPNRALSSSRRCSCSTVSPMHVLSISVFSRAYRTPGVFADVAFALCPAIPRLWRIAFLIQLAFVMCFSNAALTTNSSIRGCSLRVMQLVYFFFIIGGGSDTYLHLASVCGSRAGSETVGDHGVATLGPPGNAERQYCYHDRHSISAWIYLDGY